jgi:hypothetical protein
MLWLCLLLTACKPAAPPRLTPTSTTSAAPATSRTLPPATLTITPSLTHTATPTMMTREVGRDWLLYLYSIGGYPAIYAIRPDGSDWIKLMDEYNGIYEAVLSPDGSEIAFRANSPEDGTSDIYIMSVDGTLVRDLTGFIIDDATRRPGEQFNPAWSPDGKHLAFNSGGDIFIIAEDSSELVRLTDSTRWEGSPSWSPDGTRIAFSSERGADPDIYIINSDGTNLQRLTGSPQADGAPLWSPDGSKLYYISEHDDASDIFVMSSDGSGQTNLTQSVVYCFKPAWSPDQTRLFFSAYNDEESGYFLMNPNGSGLERFTSPQLDGRILDWKTSQALDEFAEVAAAPTVIPAPTTVMSLDAERDQAYRTLIDFFDRLHAGDYEQAASLFGGSYESLLNSNPRLLPRDRLALWKNGCEINGFVCLKVHEAILQEQAAPNEFTFMVEFEQDDGARFTLGPCCTTDESEGPAKWQFPFSVKRIGEQFLVMDMPVYMP